MGSGCGLTGFLALAVLAAIVSIAACGGGSPSASLPEAQPVTYTIDVQGMTCGNCTAAITSLVKTLPNVISCKVSLEDQEAVIQTTSPTAGPELVKAIDSLGFHAQAKPTS